MPKAAKTNLKDQPLIGAHVSAQGGAFTAFERAEQLSIKTFQLFVKNNRQWFAKAPLTEEEIKLFKLRREQWGGGPIVAHACYLINFATTTPAIRTTSEASYKEELLRANSLDVEYLVFHPGGHTGSGAEA